MDKLIINKDYYLSQVTEKDLHQLVKCFGHKSVYANILPVPHPYFLTDALEWVKQVEAEKKKYKRLINWAIRTNTGELIGGIGQMLKYGQEAKKDEIGYWLSVNYWGKGIMTKTVSAYCAYLFKNFHLTQIEAIVFSRNKASERVLQKCNFYFVKELKQAFEKDGEWLNAKVYVLQNRLNK